VTVKPMPVEAKASAATDEAVAPPGAVAQNASMVRAAAVVAIAAALLLPACERADDTDAGADPVITLVLVGDVGINVNRAPVHADGLHVRDRVYSWQELTAGIAPLIAGDLNFMNLETVVTDSNELPATKRWYNFRSHPDGVRHLVDIGFNLMSLANNHSFDYGVEGIRDTLRHVDSYRSDGLLGHAGLGMNADEAAKPAVVRKRGESIAFAAVGIVWQKYRAGKDKAGQLSPKRKADMALVTQKLRDTDASFHVLSIHEGSQFRVRPSAGVRKRWRSAVTDGGVDLIVGHHAHVARGVERIGDSIIFWGLGDFLLLGNPPDHRRLRSLELCRDFGLLARVHLLPDGKGRLRTRAVEIIPIGGVSRLPEKLPADAASERVELINHLSAMLDDRASGAIGLRFAPREDGSGLYCFEGAEAEPGKVGELCRAYQPPAPLTSERLARIEKACRALTAAERYPRPTYPGLE
jgi:poly-gamma-glutamate synthesis protein (capsule biosynthesis protein)